MRIKPVRRLSGLFLLYDGFRVLVSPTAYTREWETGILTLDDMLEYLAERPDLTRKLSIVEIAVGFWLTLG